MSSEVEEKPDEGVTQIPLAPKYVASREQRYVAFHPDRGVFITARNAVELWSREVAGVENVPKAAMTFSKEEFEKQYGNEPCVAARICYPDLKQNMISQDQLASAGLERWSS